GRRKLANSKNLVYTPTLPSGKSIILSSGPGSSGCSVSDWGDMMTYSVGRPDPYTIMGRVNTESRLSVTDAPYPRVAAVGKLSVTALSGKPEEVAAPCAGGYENLSILILTPESNRGIRSHGKTNGVPFIVQGL
nr:hypothetical protein [Tanacetum cinerariifolium]